MLCFWVLVSFAWRKSDWKSQAKCDATRCTTHIWKNSLWNGLLRYLSICAFLQKKGSLYLFLCYLYDESQCIEWKCRENISFLDLCSCGFWKTVVFWWVMWLVSDLHPVFGSSRIVELGSYWVCVFWLVAPPVLPISEIGIQRQLRCQGSRTYVSAIQRTSGHARCSLLYV